MNLLEQQKERNLQLVRESTLPDEIKNKVFDFYQEYELNKASRLVTSLKGLSDEELEKVWYADLEKEELGLEFSKCVNLKVLLIENCNYLENIITNIKFSNLIYLAENQHGYGNIFNKIQCTNLLFLNLDYILELPSFDKNKQLLIIQLWELDIKYKKILFTSTKNLIKLDITGKANTYGKEISSKYLMELTINHYWYENSINKEFVDSIKNYINLRKLTLTNSVLTEFPNELLQLTQLEHIDLSHNNITYIPEEIENLRKLKYLNLSGNNLQTLPVSLAKLPIIDFQIADNPFDKMPELINAGNIGAMAQLRKMAGTDGYDYTNFQIPKELVTPISQYLLFFKEYVRVSKNKNINFELKEVANGLTLITNGGNDVVVEELRNYLLEYIDLATQDLKKWSPEVQNPMQADIYAVDLFRLQAEIEVTSLRNKLEIGRLQIEAKNEKLGIFQAEINKLTNDKDFLKGLVNQLLTQKQEIKVEISQTITNKELAQKEFNSEDLTTDLLRFSQIIQKRKTGKEKEDEITDKFTDLLDSNHYEIADQSRVGVGKRTDITVKNPKTKATAAIIEALMLNSFNKDNTTIAEHIGKLLTKYDTAGCRRNFVLVYSTTKDFSLAWEKYILYLKDLPHNPNFNQQCEFLSFFDENTKYNSPTDIKIGKALHKRNGDFVEIVHIFVNWFVE
jgi:hypothetical protein